MQSNIQTRFAALAAFLGVAACVILSGTSLPASVIFQEVELTTAPNQIFSSGEFGSGVFWRPTFPLDPFTLDVGDTIDVTVQFDRLVSVTTSGIVEQDTAAAVVFNPNNANHNSTQFGTFDFLDVTGDLLPQHLSGTSSTGGGVGIFFNPLNASATSYSFGGVHFSLTVISGTGFPAVFDAGMLAVQTQGSIGFSPIPEPSSLVLLGTGFISLLAFACRRYKVGWSEQRSCR